jgi:hypothetical protein
MDDNGMETVFIFILISLCGGAFIEHDTDTVDILDNGIMDFFSFDLTL